jgi:dihydroxy-acid dehydratase
MKSNPDSNLRQYSGPMLDGPERAVSRGMLYAVGFKKEDFQKSVVGIASTWSMVTPCNAHIDGLARASAGGADEAGGKSIIFNTITVSDGISMGTEGIRSRRSLRAKGSTAWSRSAVATKTCRAV